MTIHKINRGQMPRAGDWNRLADAYNAGSYGLGGVDGERRVRIVGKNDSGSDRSRFECMSLADDPSIALTTDGQVDLIFSLVTADPDKPPAILTEPIADGQLGAIIIDGLAIALVGPAGATTDDYALPDAANHRLDPQSGASGIRLLGSPSTSTNKLLPVLLGGTGSGGGVLIAKTPVGGIAAATGAGTAASPYVWGSATCNLIDPDTGEPYSPNRTETIYNLANVAIGAEVAIKAEQVGSKYFVDVASCPSAYA